MPVLRLTTRRHAAQFADACAEAGGLPLSESELLAHQARVVVARGGWLGGYALIHHDADEVAIVSFWVRRGLNLRDRRRVLLRLALDVWATGRSAGHASVLDPGLARVLRTLLPTSVRVEVGTDVGLPAWCLRGSVRGLLFRALLGRLLPHLRLSEPVAQGHRTLSAERRRSAG